MNLQKETDNKGSPQKDLSNYITQQHQSLKVSNASSNASSKLSNSQIASPQDLKVKYPVNNYLFILFNILTFVIQFNYAIQNSIITMLMISFATPDIVDSLVWIIPNIIAILIRPYVIRYVHKAHKAHKIRSQAFLINGFLLIGTFGAFIIAQSCLMNQSKKGTHGFRIFICAIGWTFTGMSFQLCEYFIQKLKESLKENCYLIEASPIGNKKTQNNQQLTLKDQSFVLINFDQQQNPTSLTKNYEFLGALCGYLIVFVMFAFTLKNTLKMKSFFYQSHLCYTVCGIFTLICFILSLVLTHLSNLPYPDPQIKVKPFKLRLSYSPSYYLSGLNEIKFISSRGLLILVIHFCINFVMDVMFIYTTMWTATSWGAEDMKQGEANFYGIRNGVMWLLLYTVFFYGDIIPRLDPDNFKECSYYIGISSILATTAFFFNHSFSFLPLIISLCLMNKVYSNSIQPYFQSLETQIAQTKQLVIRAQKVAVLNVLPFVTMILLRRDDIQDCLIWCSVLLIIILVALLKIKPKYQIQTTENNQKQQLAQKQQIAAKQQLGQLQVQKTKQKVE